MSNYIDPQSAVNKVGLSAYSFRSDAEPQARLESAIAHKSHLHILHIVNPNKAKSMRIMLQALFKQFSCYLAQSLINWISYITHNISKTSYFIEMLHQKEQKKSRKLEICENGPLFFHFLS